MLPAHNCKSTSFCQNVCSLVFKFISAFSSNNTGYIEHNPCYNLTPQRQSLLKGFLLSLHVYFLKKQNEKWDYSVHTILPVVLFHLLVYFEDVFIVNILAVPI